VTTTPGAPSNDGISRWSLRRSTVRALRRVFGTASLEDWQLDVETSLRDLRARGAVLGDARVRADHRLDELQRTLDELQRTRDELQCTLDELQRTRAVFTFDAWLDLERPESDATVTVVMATRNRAAHLGAAIDSVRGQRHERWELIVVDDGSTDSTPEILAEVQEQRVRVLHLDHIGVCAARNVALAAATGDVVTYLDDDNIMHPGWLQAVAWAFSRSPHDDVLYGARIIDDARAVMSGSPGGLPFVQFAAFDRERLAGGNLADMNVIAHRREHPEARFDEQLSQLGDWELFARLTESRDPLELPATACAYGTTASDRLSDRPEHLSAHEHDRVRAIIAERAARRRSVTGSGGES
jgi:Glycosyl transferase family 2